MFSPLRPIVSTTSVHFGLGPYGDAPDHDFKPKLSRHKRKKPLPDRLSEKDGLACHFERERRVNMMKNKSLSGGFIPNGSRENEIDPPDPNSPYGLQRHSLENAIHFNVEFLETTSPSRGRQPSKLVRWFKSFSPSENRPTSTALTPAVNPIDPQLESLLKAKIEQLGSELANRLSQAITSNSTLQSVHRQLFPPQYLREHSGNIRPNMLTQYYAYLTCQMMAGEFRKLLKPGQLPDEITANPIRVLTNQFALMLVALNTGNFIEYTKPDKKAGYGEVFEVSKLEGTEQLFSFVQDAVAFNRELLVQQASLNERYEQAHQALGELKQTLSLLPVTGKDKDDQKTRYYQMHAEIAAVCKSLADEKKRVGRALGHHERPTLSDISTTIKLGEDFREQSILEQAAEVLGRYEVARSSDELLALDPRQQEQGQIPANH